MESKKLKPAKQALADAIHQNGGWPDVATFSVSGHGCENTLDTEFVISFFNGKNKPSRDGNRYWSAGSGDSDYCGDEHSISITCLMPNWHRCVLSREEYYLTYPKAYADGWIEWNGLNISPVKNGVEVDIKFPDGEVATVLNPAFMRWSHHESPSDIIAYRLHKPEIATSAREPKPVPVPEAKPTIEQLVQDYRNKMDFANSKQQEADDAKAAADAVLGELERAGEEIGLLLSPIREGKKPEINIIDWRDLMVGDEIICSEDGNWNCDLAGNVCVVREIESQEYTGCMPILAEYCDASYWGDKFTFVRRP